MKIGSLFFLIALTSCSFDEEQEKQNEWIDKRVKFLLSEDGYLNLAGLFNVSQGYYSMGSDTLNDIVLPNVFPKDFGKVFVTDSTISYEFYEKVLYKDSINTTKAFVNNFKKEEYFTWKNFRMYVHFDSGVKAIRLRDMNHPLLDQKIKLDMFKYDNSYEVIGKFLPYKTEKKIKLSNVQGVTFYDRIPGKFVFKLLGKEYELEPTYANSGNFFVVFGDATNGNTTYGGGRFMYVNLPDDNGNVTLNFNESFNPPCVFSSFTTCPIPSKNNILNIPIIAGEKNYNGLSFSSVYQ